MARRSDSISHSVGLRRRVVCSDTVLLDLVEMLPGIDNRGIPSPGWAFSDPTKISVLGIGGFGNKTRGSKPWRPPMQILA